MRLNATEKKFGHGKKRADKSTRLYPQNLRQMRNFNHKA